jgi:FHA domain-containing protein
MTSDAFVGLFVLALRIGVVVALFLFVVQSLRTLRAELASGLRAAESGNRDGALLEVVNCDGVPGLSGRLYPLDGQNSIGRDANNTVAIPDARVSAKHARLLWRGGGWWIEDLGSTNGTFLNGNAVTGAARVSPADVVQVGPASLKLRAA